MKLKEILFRLGRWIIFNTYWLLSEDEKAWFFALFGENGDDC